MNGSAEKAAAQRLGEAIKQTSIARNQLTDVSGPRRIPRDAQLARAENILRGVRDELEETDR